MPEQDIKFSRHAMALLVLGALGRFPMMILLRHTPILVYSDLSYIKTAQDILRFNFRALGDRVPVYPLLVAVCGLNPHVIWFAQSALGIMASLMIFDMAFRRTRHGLYSLLVGLVCSLGPDILVYESSIMAEALTNFLLVTSLWLMTRCDGAGESKFRYRLGLGAIIALTALTRPLMICLVPVYFCFLVPVWPPAKFFQRKAITRALSFVLPAVVFILGWCGFNYINNGYFTPTTLSGENLMDQVDPYVNLAPERFRVLRDAWLQARRQINGNPNQSATLVYGGAVPELERRTGKTNVQIAHEYEILALYLEFHHPLLCLRRAEQAWIEFWGEPTLDEIEWPQGSQVRLDEFLMTLYYFLVREVEAVFLVMALLSIPCALFRPKAFAKLEYLTFAIALLVSVFAGFTEFGENRRFCVPFYMLIVYTLLTRGWQWIAANSSAGSGLISDQAS